LSDSDYTGLRIVRRWEGPTARTGDYESKSIERPGNSQVAITKCSHNRPSARMQDSVHFVICTHLDLFASPALYVYPIRCSEEMAFESR
jgi:hypothetical protein